MVVYHKYIDNTYHQVYIIDVDYCIIRCTLNKAIVKVLCISAVSLLGEVLSIREIQTKLNILDDNINT